MRCFISQPTFLPWLGWFDLALNADVTILLDTVQFDKRSWQQRNRIRTAQGLQYVTVPVLTAGRFHQTIADVEIADHRFCGRLLRTLEGSYGRAPCYQAVISELKDELVDLMSSTRLIELNIPLIRFLCSWLGIETKMVRASELKGTGERGEYLACLCQQIGASVYLSTHGAREYLLEDLESFSRRGIRVCLHSFRHPEYPQLYSPFLPYASAIDLVMMTGRNSGSILRNADRKWTPLEHP